MVSSFTKHLGVRSRVGFWLLIVAVVVAGSGLILSALTRNQLQGSSEESLQQLVQLEQSRIVTELNDVRQDIRTVATDPKLIASLTRPGAPTGDLDESLEQLLQETQQAGQDFVALALVTRNGSAFSQTSTARPVLADLANDAMERRTIVIGPAFEDDSLVLVTPVVSDVGEVLGSLSVEMRLTPILQLGSRYESFGDTAEAFVAQQSSDGSCRMLTDLRFDRSAAYSEPQGDLADVCRNFTDDQLFEGTDYRGAETLSAWSSVPSTDWIVVVKQDTAEVFKLLDQVRLTITTAALLASAILAVGWFALVRPIGSRLFKAAAAAEQLASGNFDAYINDPGTDEIGRMSDSMDHLAQELAIDIERRERAEARLRVLADTDSLTGLMNRRRMTDQLQTLTDDKIDFTVVFLDLDGFKEINDAYGHSIGDEVLKLVAARLQGAIDHHKPSCGLARWGGDEFVILCPGSNPSESVNFAEVIDGLFDTAFRTSAGVHRVGVSIGSAEASNGIGVEQVLSAADASMYQMKRRGDQRHRVSPQSIKYVEQALRDNRVLSYLQPLVSIDADGGVHLCGAEALVRIENEDGSISTPFAFLPGLGASEQALALDLRILQRASAATADWLRRELVPPDFYVSVNLGAAAMADARLVDKIVDVIDEQKLNPRNLVVEIPETAGDIDVDQIEELRNLGIRIAIDDVGCQFSNLERLVDIPADIAKIDRRWLPDGDPEGSNKLELLTGLFQQCRMLDLQTFVEGIETDVQLDIVREIGVERVQGFLFGRPAEPTHFERLWSRPNGQSLRVVSSSQ